MPRFILAVAACLIVGLSPGLAETVLPGPTFAPGSGVEMRITNCYEEIPPLGFLPLRVEVKNGSGQTRQWRFHAAHSQGSLRSVQYSTNFEVEASGERTFDLLVPLAPMASNTSRYSSLQIMVSGYGVTDGSASDHSSTRGKPPTDFIGMGDELVTKNWGPLRDELEKKHNRGLDGTALDPGFLPKDWRGLAGFEMVFLSEAEWRGLGAEEREALQDWISQGGRLFLCHAGTTAPPDLPTAGAVGSGRIELWPLEENFVERAANLLSKNTKSLSGEALQNYTWRWDLAEAVGRAEPPQTLIVVFVLAFGLVIGPLNFLVLAPLGKRHRLFWTTPLLSVSATALMGLFIFLSEGVGGSGQRIEAELSLPAERKSVIWQEQVSRTGVLLGSNFTLSEPALILPVSLKDNSGSSRLTADRGIAYSLTGATWSGDWFRSRNTQAQVLAAVIPARGKLEIHSGENGPPVAVSSYDKELAEIWYFDQSGAAWRGSNLRPGEKQTLKSTEPKAFSGWWKKSLEAAGPVIRSRAEAYGKGGPKGKFFATTARPKPINSLSSIRWKDAGGVIFGQVAP